MTPTVLLGRLLRPLAAIVAAFVVSAAVYQLTGYSVVTILRGAIDGSIGSPDALTSSLRWSIPLLLIGLGVAVAFKAGYYNVGGQGQMYMGALASLTVGLYGDGRSAVLFVPLSILAGIVAGALWSLIPGLLKIYLGADEVVTTLMMNFIAVLFLEWAAAGPLKSGAGSGQAATTRALAPGYRLSDGSGVSPQLAILAAVVLFAVWVFVRRTRTGLDIVLVGRNPVMASWQGIGVSRIGLLVFAVSGGSAGLAGVLETFGPAGAISAGFSPDVGFVGVIVALVGGLDPLAVVLTALFFGGLRAATLYMAITTDLPQSALDLLNGLVALLITARLLPRAWNLRRRRRTGAVRVEEDVTPTAEVAT